MAKTLTPQKFVSLESAPQFRPLENRGGGDFARGLFRVGSFVSQLGHEINRAKSATSVGQGRPLLSGGGRQVPLQLSEGGLLLLLLIHLYIIYLLACE